MNLLRLIKLIEIFIETPEEINTITLAQRNEFPKREFRYLIFKTTKKSSFEIYKELSEINSCEKHGPQGDILSVLV